MIRAKNYETVSKFVKIMPRILWPLFPGHGLYSNKRVAEVRVSLKKCVMNLLVAERRAKRPVKINS